MDDNASQTTDQVYAAAIQLSGRVGDIDYNLSLCEKLLLEALENGANVVALPEFFTTPVVLDERLFYCGLMSGNNEALDLLTSLSKRYSAMIGGSYIEIENDHTYNSYVLVEPCGRVSKHRKDIPTMIEHAFYVPGNDNGIGQTRFGSVGMAVCWETIRSQTVKRLSERVDLLMTGSQWWSEPGWPIFRRFLDKQHLLNAQHMKRAPGRFAKLIGAPNIHAAYCGELHGRYALTPSISTGFSSQLMGETQITDANGNILARRTKEQGPGVIYSKLNVGRVKPTETCPTSYWLEPLPLTVKAIWHQQNWVGKKLYQQRLSGHLGNF